MAGPLTAQEIDAAVAGGHLDPILGNAMKAKLVPVEVNPSVGAPGVGNPLMSPGAPVPPVDNVSMVLGPKATPPPAPAPVDPGPLAVFPHLAPKPQPAGPPPGPPSPAPAPAAPIGPAHKAGSALLGPSAPKQPVDVTNFGKTPHEIASEQAELGHLGNVKGFQGSQSAIEAEQASAFAEQAETLALDADKRARMLEANAAKRRQFLDTYNAKTEQAIDNFAKAEIDPNRAFAKAGNGSLFVSMIGVALSGVGQMFKARAGMDPGRNGAMDQIEKMIAQDIDLQKAHIAKQGAGIDARKGLYASYLQQFGSEDAAEAMAYEGYLRKAKATVDAQMAKTSSKEVKLRGEVLSEALDHRIAQFANSRAIVGEKMYEGYQAKLAAAQAAQASEIRKRNEAVFKTQLAVGEERAKKIGGSVNVLDGAVQLPNGNTMPAGSVVVLDAGGNIDLSGTEAASKASTVSTITGFNAKGQPMYGTGTAFSPDDKKKFDEGAKIYSQVKRDIKIIKDLREKHGGGALFSADDIAKANAAAKRIQLAMKSPAMYNLGQIAGADVKFLEANMPSSPLEVKAVGIVGSDPIGVTINETEQSLDAIYKNAEAAHLKGGADANSALPLTAPK